MSHTFHIRRFLVLLVATLLAAASLVLLPSPANAHDELSATDPAADSTLDALPEQLTLTFSGLLLDDDGATEIAVTDAAGTSLAAGPPVVDDNVVTQPLSGEAGGGAASGVVTVLWKVVSSDGHPISGEFAFTVDAPAPVPTETATPTPTPTASATPSPTETPAPEDPLMTAVDMRPWFIGALVLLALVAGAVMYLLISRARREKALAEASRGSAADSDPGSDPSPER